MGRLTPQLDAPATDAPVPGSACTCTRARCGSTEGHRRHARPTLGGSPQGPRPARSADPRYDRAVPIHQPPSPPRGRPETCPRWMPRSRTATRVPPRRLARGAGPGQGRAVPRRDLLGPRRPGLRRRQARILLVGLAPAAHGANRTGRVFTGDASGDFLWKALHAVGLADRPVSRRASDGLALRRPRQRRRALRAAGEQANAGGAGGLPAVPGPGARAARRLRVIVPLGGIGWDATLRSLATLGYDTPTPKPRFGHGAEAIVGPYTLLGTTTRASRTRSRAGSPRR